MPICTTLPLAASADTAVCATPEPVNSLPYQFCCATMGTRSNQCCDGCSVCESVHVALALYATLHFVVVDPCITCALAAAAYIALHTVQRRTYISGLQLLQASLCLYISLAASMCRSCSIVIWFCLLAAILHIGVGISIYEIARLGDCRRCMNEAHRCTCGRQKDPVQQGSLRTLAMLVEAKYTRHASQRPS